MNVAAKHDEDNTFSNDSNRPVSQYDEIDDDGVLTPSSIDEDQLFDKRERQGQMCMTLELIMPPLSSR